MFSSCCFVWTKSGMLRYSCCMTIINRRTRIYDFLISIVSCIQLPNYPLRIIHKELKNNSFSRFWKSFLSIELCDLIHLLFFVVVLFSISFYDRTAKNKTAQESQNISIDIALSHTDRHMLHPPNSWKVQRMNIVFPTSNVQRKNS